MKEIIGFDQAIGGDGAQASGSLGVEGENLKLQVGVTYPLAKVVEPATKAVDGLLNKLKDVIPGDWDDVMIEKFKAEYKEELVKLLAE